MYRLFVVLFVLLSFEGKGFAEEPSSDLIVQAMDKIRRRMKAANMESPQVITYCNCLDNLYPFVRAQKGYGVTMNKKGLKHPCCGRGKSELYVRVICQGDSVYEFFRSNNKCSSLVDGKLLLDIKCDDVFGGKWPEDFKSFRNKPGIEAIIFKPGYVVEIAEGSRYYLFFINKDADPLALTWENSESLTWLKWLGSIQGCRTKVDGSVGVED